MSTRDRRARTVQPRRCIYCLEEKVADAFNREHVIPEAFGKFQPAKGDGDAPITIDCVCTDCNDRFGKSLDRWLSRDSVLGLLRFNEGVKKPGEFKPPSRDAGLTITPTDRELAGGAKLLLGHSADGTFGFHVERKVGFAPQEAGPYEYFSPDTLPSRDEVRARFGHRPSFDMPGLSREEVASVMQRLGFRYDITREVPAPQRADVTIPIGREQFRAIAKIAFNYAAWIIGAEVACMRQFDGLRAYILAGERPGPPFVTVGKLAFALADAQGGPRRGHFVTVQNSDTGLLAQVSLFSAIRFRVDLTHVPLALTTPCDAGHFFDLDARTVEPVRLPRIGGRILEAPAGVHIRLDR